MASRARGNEPRPSYRTVPEPPDDQERAALAGLQLVARATGRPRVRGARSPDRPGDSTIYGPTLSTFHQQQKLRPYYDFMDVDTVRYNVGGEPRLYARASASCRSSSRSPGSRGGASASSLFTHGYGLVMSPTERRDRRPASPFTTPQSIPIETAAPELATENPAVYYGEGAGSMAYSNVHGRQGARLPDRRRPCPDRLSGRRGGRGQYRLAAEARRVRLEEPPASSTSSSAT